jgi:YD repeat-containing protein
MNASARFRIFSLLAITISLQPVITRAQESEQASILPMIVPMAPNAVALTKFTDFPVSTYTGSPEISIPIYEIKQGSLSVPISLNYHASGIKVDDIAPWTGLGWSLSAGGSLTRTVRGLMDEKPGAGFLSQGYKVADETSYKDYDYLYNVAITNLWDSESDMYFLNLPSGGAKFWLDYKGNIIQQNYRQIKFERLPSWKATTEDGTQYLFGKSGSYGGIDETTVAPEAASPVTSLTAWHLNQMSSPDGTDKIYFEYNNIENVSYDLSMEETYYERDLDYILHNPFWINCTALTPSHKLPGTNISIDQSLISRIVYDGGSVEFLTSYGRPDLNGGNTLARINIKNDKGEIIKYFEMIYSSFGSGSGARLRLDQVREYAPDGKALPPYKFEYERRYPLPERGSTKQDHWGYYNNNTKNTFIPRYILRSDDSYRKNTFLDNTQGGDRDTDPNNTKSSMLTQITFPTGGFTTFEYEAHEVAAFGQGKALEYYDSTIIDFRARPDKDNQSVSLSQIFKVDKTYTAFINVGGGCYGKVAVAADAVVSGYGVSVGWGCKVQSNSGYYTFYPDHIYQAEAQADYDGELAHANAYVQVTLKKTREINPASTKIYAGGVRVKRIKRYESATAIPVVTRYDYTAPDKDGNTVSSGVVVRKPNYYFNYLGSTEVDGGTLACPYEAGYSSPKIPLGEGTHIGYSKVTVLQGENGENGREELFYTTALTDPDVGGTNFPYPPEHSNDFNRGLLLERRIYDNQNHLRSTVSNDYEKAASQGGPGSYFGQSLKIGSIVYRGNKSNIVSDFKASFYTNSQSWQYLTKTTERNYSQANNDEYAETVTRYYYDRIKNHAQITRIEQDLPDGTTLKTLLKYPQDYVTGNSDLTNINALVNAHVVNTSVETQQWKIGNNKAKLVSGRISDFDVTTTKPNKIYLIEADQPIESLNNENSSDEKFTNLISDTEHYKLKAEFTYSNGRVETQKKTDDITTSYLWSYHNLYPIAQVTNAQKSDIAYSSFEQLDFGSWSVSNQQVDLTQSFTGSGSYSLGFNASISKDGLDAGKTYVIAFWAKDKASVLVNDKGANKLQSRNGWNYFETTVSQTPTVSIKGFGSIDELRLFPQGAQMTTYTYSLGKGLTSVTNPSGQPAFYEYDGFTRLKNVRDADKFIVKQNDYQYKNQ